MWTLPIDGSFGDATNWTPNGVPDAEATAVFGSGIYIVSGTGAAGAVQVAGTPTFTGAISVDGLAGTSQAVAIADGGALTVSGGSLTTTGSVDVAQGSLTLNNGATGNFSGNGDAGPTYALQIGIAQYNSGSFYGDGTIKVDGSGTILTTDTGILVGAGGSGTLTISNGAAVSTGDTLGAALAETDIGDVGEGTVTVTGTGSSLTTAAPLVIAAATDSYGSLTIADGATVTSDAGDGDYAGIISPDGYSEGNVTIEGAGSEWTVEQNLALGLESSAYVMLQDGGVLAVDGTAIVANAGGTLNLSGAGTALQASNAAMTMQNFSLVIDSASSVSLASLTLQEHGSLFLGLGTDAAEALSNLTLADTLAVNGGRVELNQGSADIGQITIGDGGDVQIGSAVVDLNSAVTMDGGTFDELDGAPSAGFILTGGVDLVYTESPVAMTFASGADADLVTQSTNITSVSGFGLGDTLDLTDIDYTGGATATLGQNDVLTISTLYGTYQVQLAPDENFNGLNFVVNNDPTHGGVDVRLTTEPGLTFTWAQPADGSFDDAANWTPAGGPPGPEQTAVLGAGTYTVTGPGTAGQIEVDGTTTLAGAFTALGDSAGPEAFTVDQGGNVTLATGASLTVGDDADSVAAVIGDLSTGAFTVDAQSTFTDYGDLSRRECGQRHAEYREWHRFGRNDKRFYRDRCASFGFGHDQRSGVFGARRQRQSGCRWHRQCGRRSRQPCDRRRRLRLGYRPECLGQWHSRTRGRGAPSQSDFRKCGRRDNRRWIDIRRCQQCRNDLREPKHTRLRGQCFRRHVRHQSEHDTRTRLHREQRHDRTVRRHYRHLADR